MWFNLNYKYHSAATWQTIIQEQFRIEKSTPTPQYVNNAEDMEDAQNVLKSLIRYFYLIEINSKIELRKGDLSDVYHM